MAVGIIWVSNWHFIHPPCVAGLLVCWPPHGGTQAGSPVGAAVSIYASLCGTVLPFRQDKHPVQERLNHEVSVHLTSSEATKLFSKVAIPFCNPTRVRLFAMTT
jgi:hypothetical protein